MDLNKKQLIHFYLLCGLAGFTEGLFMENKNFLIGLLLAIISVFIMYKLVKKFVK